MNPEIKQLWIDWLEANGDRQGRFKLFNGKNYCCLGGLCQLHYEQTGSPGFEQNEYEYYSYEGVHAFISDTVMTWAGLQSDNPVVLLDEIGAVSLAELNDDLRLTFHQIAQVIREQL